MRALVRLTLTALALVLPVLCRAEIMSRSGYELTVVRKEGAAFSGLAEDDSGLIVTDLSAGRLYRFKDGAFHPFGPELPHGFDVTGEPTGPYRVTATDDGYLVSQGWTPIGADSSPVDHAIIAITDRSEPHVISSDFWNPFDFIVDGGGFLVVDAARNSLERLSKTGERTTLHIFGRLSFAGSAVERLSPTEFPKQESYAVEAVPTAAAKALGRIFVTLFSGFPYVHNGGMVVSLDLNAPAVQARVEIDGLNSPVDLHISADGDPILVLEHGRYRQAAGFLPETGRLLLADSGGEVPQPLVWGLTKPVSFIERRDGTIAIACLDGTLVFLSSRDDKPL